MGATLVNLKPKQQTTSLKSLGRGTFARITDDAAGQHNGSLCYRGYDKIINLQTDAEWPVHVPAAQWQCLPVLAGEQITLEML